MHSGHAAKAPARRIAAKVPDRVVNILVLACASVRLFRCSEGYPGKQKRACWGPNWHGGSGGMRPLCRR